MSRVRNDANGNEGGAAAERCSIAESDCAGVTLFAWIASGAVAFAQFLTLFFRQILIFPPALVQLFMFFRRKLFHAFVALDCLCALLGRQRNPFMHALLNSLLPIRWQVWIARGQTYPVLASLRVELVPLLLKRGQDGFLFRCQFRPGRAGRIGKCETGGRRRADIQVRRQDYCRDCM